MERRLVLTLAATILGLAACDSSTPAPTMDGEFSAVRVFGTVRNAAGAPVAGAVVLLQARDPASCQTQRDRTSTVTDSAGRYATVLGNWGSPFDACVRVWATPASGSGIAADSSTAPLVRIGGPWADSLRVDVVLPPAP